MVISGKDRGTTGTIVRAMPKEDKVVIEGVNIVKKHQRRTKASNKGQILERSMPIHVSNVQILDPKSGKPTRIRISREGGGYSRVAQKSGARFS